METELKCHVSKAFALTPLICSIIAVFYHQLFGRCAHLMVDVCICSSFKWSQRYHLASTYYLTVIECLYMWNWHEQASNHRLSSITECNIMPFSVLSVNLCSSNYRNFNNSPRDAYIVHCMLSIHFGSRRKFFVFSILLFEFL